METELLNDFYYELLDIMDEKTLKLFYDTYQGMVINTPKKLYDSKKIAEKLSQEEVITFKTKQEFARKYNYSQRHIERLLNK